MREYPTRSHVPPHTPNTMTEKLNSMRLLEQKKVAFTVRDFPDTIHSADGVADHFGLPHDVVYKTLVVLPPKGKPMLIMVAGSRELDLKKVAKATGYKKVQMASKKEAESLTGLQTGGISALALLHKSFTVYIDKPAIELDNILVSAGKRGVNLELPVKDLIKITKAKAVEVT
ncbi:MAG: aminoacyl-tRNA deacylase [Anaerolineae bacterium]|nr:aminoacyl-tRNA deacylase [Anaerolineae bacterium]